MTDQNTFMEIVQNVAEIVRTSEVPMSEEEILAYFSDVELDENQKRMVLEYILTAEQREQEESENVEEQGESQVDASVEEEEPRSKVYQMYLEELANLPAVKIGEREELYRKLLQGDSGVIETISEAWLKKVLTIAEKYMEPKLNIEDLIQEGNMALFLKLQELLGSRPDTAGGQSVGDVETRLTEAIEEGIMSYASMMNGDREQENTLVGKISLVHEAKKLLAMEKGEEPTVEELAQYTKMTVRELEDLEEIMKKRD